MTFGEVKRYMKRTKSASIVWLACFCLVFCNDALSWDDKVTHRDLSKYASENSVLGKGYLSNIGLNKGLDNEVLEWAGSSTIQKGSIQDWIREGSQLEDAGAWYNTITGTSRFKNHFHDPTKIPSQAGLSDIQSGESAMLWAQDSANQQTYVEKDKTWSKVRELYRLALTSSTATERQAYFAQTFVGLGHQIHLVQDMAVPEHTRNDAHTGLGTYDSRFFEKWAKDKPGIINSYAANPVFPTVSFDAACDSLAPVPVCNLFDTRQYYSSKTPSVSLAQGLAEYTNANFFSDDTIFAAGRYTEGDKHYFPYPKKSSTNLEAYEKAELLPKEITAEDGIKDVGFYISKTSDGEVIGNFVRPAYLTLVAKDVDGMGKNIYERSFYRDEACHDNYAAFLVPRAVGYSAWLLNHFFRGNINLEQDTSGQNKVIIRNLSQETLDGYFKLYYDDVNGNRIVVKSPDITDEKGLYLKLGTNEPSQPIAFIHPVLPRPEKEGRYVVVFYGKAGIEDNVAIGKVVESIKLPVPYVFVVQNRIVINSQPEETSSQSFNTYSYDNAAIGWDSAATGYVDSYEVGKNNKWDTSKQYAEGVFLSHMDISEIGIEYSSATLAAYGISILPLPRFYINNQLINGGIWRRGNSSGQPTTWKIENAVGSRLDLLASIVIKFVDGTIVRQGICSYSGVSQVAGKRLYGVYVKNPEGTTSTTPNPIYLRSAISSRLDLTGISTRLAISNIGGYTERYSYNNWTDPDGSIHYWSESVNASGVNYSHEDHWNMKSKTWDSALAMFDSLGDYIPLSISGRLDRVYSQEELDNLQSLGIEPVSYSITVE